MKLSTFHPALWALLAIAISTSGCASSDSARDKGAVMSPGQTTFRVKSFEIKGTEKFDADTIKKGLATQKDPGWRASIPWMPILGAEHSYYNQIDWRRDVERIKTFYSMRGYFNARIVNKSISQSAKNEEVRISITIAEGTPTRVTELNVEGLEALEPGISEEVLRDLQLKVGEVFTQEKYIEMRNTLVSRLKLRSFAYARISGRVVIDPQTQSAKVQYFLDPGPQAVFGEVHIIGNDEIDTRFIREALAIKQGVDYSARELDRAQADIYDMGVFSLVSVLPAHEASDELLREAGISKEEVALEREDAADSDSEPGADGSGSNADIYVDEEEDDEDDDEDMGMMGISGLLAAAQEQAESRTELSRDVPIIVRVKEARLWNVEVGAGVSVGTNRSDIHGLANWSSQNFLGGLRRLEHFNTAGYAWASNDSSFSLSNPFSLGGTSDASNEGVFLESRLEFRQPQFFERLTTLKSSLSLKRKVEVGYTVWNPQFTVGVERRFFRHLNLELNYQLSYFKYADVGESLLTTPELGQGFEPSYLLESLEQRATLDLRDDPFNPTAGFLTALSLQEAGSFLAGGEFDFLKVSWSNQAYVPFHLLTKWVLAGRFRAGAIYNTEPTRRDSSGNLRARSVPIENRFYAGGAASLRGLGRNNLSYFRVAAFNPTIPGDIRAVEVIPIGGMTVFEASIEPRFELAESLFGLGDLWGVLFYDVATVLNQQFYFDTKANATIEEGTATFESVAASLINGAGAGLFWLTPVGPVRADFAVTLNDLQNDPRFRICGDFARVRENVSQSGRSDCEYLPASRDPIVQQLNLDYSFFIGIGHSF
ncbi:BamA/OMP85 family outer membrane protein [Bradymonas sediminis]|uniref:Uncharacterized protein n=1 Tax=Bradymonas sediminis TaxID=1548548 RepID=A0A2Z4FMH8_9DELT|nr:BamA/TamA family outer membrane protein [Bradymonas sediminis]AWV90132.1 hypothetical protein DN745_12635 [Bradymonas sediminis]TDP75900.1 outer membrane protein assembly factor BamA [Bradymonas sediminis]